MSKILHICSILFWGLCVTTIQAKEMVDTLVSETNDRIIVRYDVNRQNEFTTISFLEVKKRIGPTYQGKYHPDEVAVLFFDRVGKFDDQMEFSGITIDAFMIPDGVKYHESKNGYFILNHHPSISFETISAKDPILSIPLFLAHFERSRRFKVFAQCGELRVSLSSHALPLSSNTIDSPTADKQKEVKDLTNEQEDPEIADAVALANLVSYLLYQQEEYPFSDELKQDMANLRLKSYRISDKKVSSRISKVLAECDQKEKELKDIARAKEEDKENEAIRKAELEQQKQNARQDSINHVAQLKEEKEQKQRIWLIIGGAILALLTFVGNQTIQHIRNVKNQKSMMAMQDTVVKRAENEAKRRARSMAANKVRQVKNDVKTKSRNVIKGSENNKTNNKKGYSI